MVEYVIPVPTCTDSRFTITAISEVKSWVEGGTTTK